MRNTPLAWHSDRVGEKTKIREKKAHEVVEWLVFGVLRPGNIQDHIREPSSGMEERALKLRKDNYL